MGEFRYAGQLPASKSHLNRWLCVGSYARGLVIDGDSRCDDVVRMKAALAAMAAGERTLECGAAGTVLRFLLARVSREPGAWCLTGTRKLISRPQNGLLAALGTLGVQFRTDLDSIVVEGDGWHAPTTGPVSIDRSVSSQFASALVLNAWQLPFDLELKFEGELVSEPYFEMTLDVVRRAGLAAEYDERFRVLRLPKHAVPRARRVVAEPDMSSAFAVAALAAVNGHARFEGFPNESLQADRVFPELLTRMGARVQASPALLRVDRAARLRGLEADLGAAPDLFPVLAALTLLADGPSRLFGAAHLAHKESDRIGEMVRIAHRLGRPIEARADGWIVTGSPVRVHSRRPPLVVDPVDDHRIVMAAAVLREAGHRVVILEPHCVSKSFPEFREIANVDPEPVVLVGHRGVGKTSLLEAGDIDLDREIERREGTDIPAIFATKGEAAFRKVEGATLAAQSLTAGQTVALGAGFEGARPDGHVVWVRRDADAAGRIFTDRPRLNATVGPLEEFLERVPKREARYGAWADEILTLREGASPAEARAFLNRAALDVRGAALTLLPRDFREGFEAWVDRRLAMGVLTFELRDDLLSKTQVQRALAAIPAERVLLSRRAKRAYWNSIPGDFDWDFDLDLGAPSGGPDIVSSHTRRKHESIDAFLARLERAGGDARLKAAPVVANFEELRAGDAWWRADPGRRVFLPRTEAGLAPRWAWYRLWRAPDFFLNFIREGGGSAADQPTLLEWVARRRAFSRDGFAAVLGSPVRHSRTPTEHEAFFAERGWPVFAIPVTSEEFPLAMTVLTELGLRAAAVTSPLKEDAYRLAPNGPWSSVNTLARSGAKWHSHNTDFEGAQALFQETELREGHGVRVWGGGGTLPILQAALPEAAFYSVRTSRPRESSAPDTANDTSFTLVWAAPHDAGEPPATWKPKLVVDLNYFENSPARAYALRTGARYVSGLAMFRAQAAAQRAFWDEVL